ncbi:NAD(P)H-hydrate dehydratase [Sulfitobacter sp. SK012]|uniref:NAD(P)H-hydrate dehydratase n=1 Tax=Sulfitobacter sp. SK012 TaxID=1389005 RepID=UPI000E0B4B0D|nr:NAD(P)H-hydrate dehydratase [Sulfitobacter sp. SK012]AXI47636.1 NAD(P)H-hydrate dehydratase [Sulfitobacter sp. SK012]
MATQKPQADVFEMTDARWQALNKSGDAHKHRYGHAAIVSGPVGQGGAARLAARGAIRIGAGVVSVVCDQDAVAEHAGQLNAIMVKPYSANTNFQEHLAAIKPQAICIGPNLGLNIASKKLLADVLTLGLPTCLDADAITLLADKSASLPNISNPQSVLTPHEGELRRFIPEMFAATSCRVSLAQEAARKVGCTVLFKGPETVIAAPDRMPMIVSSKPFRNTSWLATAGSGDVLAGFVTGLLARGFDGFEAAAIAADLHFRCADAFGPGLVAEDIPEILPRVFR